MSNYTVRKARSGHWHIRDRAGRLVTVTSSTPGDRRTLANLRATVNRARRPA